MFLSLNLALTLFYYYLLHSFVEASLSKGTSDAYSFLYYFLRAAVRLNKILHYQAPGYEKYARWPNAGGRLGVELAFALTTVFLAVLILTFLRLVRNLRNYNKALRYVSGFVFLFAFPLTFLWLFGRRADGTLASAFPVAIPELLCAALLYLIYLLRPLATWGMGIFLFLHYCLWALVYHGSGAGDTLYGPIPPWLFLLLVPMGGVVWLYYCKVSRVDTLIERPEKLWSKQLLAAVAVSVVGLCALWLPGRGYNLAHAKNPDSMTIEMRQFGYGVGPLYTITVHGNGAVEYIGEHFVHVHGAQTSSLNEQQMQAVLAGFDRADFFSLEDQAFAWGYHSGTVSVRITVDGKTKEVSSDTYHIGAKSGLQAKFVDAAANLDRIIETDQWVKCGEARCEK
jgi:hypothetical protein